MHHTSLFMKIFYDDKKLFDKIIHMYLKKLIIFGVLQWWVVVRGLGGD